MAGRMPHKVRKLVVKGLKELDSGKATWASVFLRIIPMKFVASITQEAQFLLSMINENTQLVFLDEWSDRTLEADMAKVVLQDGFMVQAIKHGKPRSMENGIPFYITTNELPYFGNDDVNVKRRVRVFTTKSLDSCKTNVDRWIKDNPMDCIVWCAQEIENLLNLVDPDERWYEKDALSESAVRITDRGILTGVDLPNGAGSLVFDIDKVKSLNSKDLQGEPQIDDTAVRQPSDFLHHSFKQAANNAIELAKEEISLEKQHEQQLREQGFLYDTSSDEEHWLYRKRDQNSHYHHKRVKRYLRNDFYEDKLSGIHLLSFRSKQSLKTVDRGPTYDAWMLVVGEQDPERHFYFMSFFARYPPAVNDLKRIRDPVNIRIISRDNDPLKHIRQDPLPSSSPVTLPEHSEGSTEESFQCAQSTPQSNPTQESTAPSSQLSAHEDSGENNQEVIERTQSSPLRNDQNEKCKADESSKEKISQQSDNNPIALTNLLAPPDSPRSSTNEHCQESTEERIEVAQSTVLRNPEQNVTPNTSESPTDEINLQTHNDSPLLITREDPMPSSSRLSADENSGESIEKLAEFACFTPLTNNEGKVKFDGEGTSREKDDAIPDKPANCENEQHLSENTAVESDNLVSNTDSRNTLDKRNNEEDTEANG